VTGSVRFSILLVTVSNRWLQAKIGICNRPKLINNSVDRQAKKETIKRTDSNNGDTYCSKQLNYKKLNGNRTMIFITNGSGNAHFPVLYMHDGYNLFDEATSYTGEWHVDETMEHLSSTENLEAIIVGIPRQ
jgi:hypothetical protein